MTHGTTIAQPSHESVRGIRQNDEGELDDEKRQHPRREVSRDAMNRQPRRPRAAPPLPVHQLSEECRLDEGHHDMHHRHRQQ
jgi:hypothetical protein